MRARRAGLRVEDLVAMSVTTRVSIVREREETRIFLKMLREANDYRVTAAGDGPEAPAAAL